MNSSGIIYYRDWDPATTQATPANISIPIIKPIKKQTTSSSGSFTKTLGIGLLALSLGGLLGPTYPILLLESRYSWSQAIKSIQSLRYAWATPGKIDPKPMPLVVEAPHAVPALFTPLVASDGSTIEPIDRDFGVVIPKIGVNAKVLPTVSPADPAVYLEALKHGIAHASTSYLPDEDGTTYLFSHSTNYDWFVDDLNAVFYLLKNLEEKDRIILLYKGKTYTYQITGKKVVSPQAISYLMPQKGAKKLILQTCWPPGSTSERLLIFADLIEFEAESI